MTTLQRSLANVLGRLLGAHIVKPLHVAGLYETECVRRIFEVYQIDCIFDVGANAGQYALMLRERLHFEGHIISFEPIPALAAHVRNLASRDPKWVVREVALDIACGRATLKVTKDPQFSSLRNLSSLGQKLFANSVQINEEIEVETSTLAAEVEICAQSIGFHRPYLKLDTQGHDLAVAKGAGSRLTEFVAIQTEASICKLYDDTPDLTDSLVFFQNRGFQLNAFLPNNEGTFPVLIETDCIYVNSKLAVPPPAALVA